MNAFEIQTDHTLNPSLLGEQIGALLGEAFQGMATNDAGVIVYTADALTAEQQQQITALVEAHDAAEKTPAQQAEEAREAARSQIEGEDFDTLKDAVNVSNLDAGTKAALGKLIDLIQALAIAGGYSGAV